jgi:sugar transferase (PEP-CTERM/EpsH1 system associated)
MRILYVCHRLPYPPNQGGKIRSYNTIRHLAASHAVTMISVARSPAEAAQIRGLESLCAECHVVTIRYWKQLAKICASVALPITASESNFHSLGLARIIDGLLSREKFDLVFVHCSSVARYVAELRDVPKILDFVDMDSAKWMNYARFKHLPISLGYALEGRKLKVAENRLARCFDLCTVATRAELASLESYRTGTAIDWFPNGVDAAYFSPGTEPYDPNLISFIGRMDYYPNEECMRRFCRDTLPLLRAERPDLKLIIVGANPSAKVRKLGRLPGVALTGTVADVRPYVRRSALTVAPLDIARGTQNKILESMAMGVPVVASRLAAGGVDAVPGQHFCVASDPAEYRNAIRSILTDPAERQRLSSAGRARVLSHHSWSQSMQRLDRLIERTVAGRAGLDQR